MMRRIGIALVVLGLLAVLVRYLVHEFASDDTRILWAIEDAAEGFGEARMNPVLDVLAHDFVDETSGFRREDLRGALASAFFTEKDPELKGFPYRCEIKMDTITTVKGDPDRATVTFDVLIVDTRGDARREAWSLRVEGRMEERENGWCFLATTHETRAGSMRLRAR